ncbi:hypothetical protein E6C27_scaffold501G00570 [Cucumis melo var. makuwa]|uniref:Uncharacterized protein n=2 Tax=Cucumis melo TaxID=3656 RepID=A0A5A7V0S3_CUCMM|nr:hypothetical protein E6C27_scaffold501G00570 [Cucumis melo var. makuwa]
MHQSQEGSSEKINEEEGAIGTKVVKQMEPTNEGTTVVHLTRKQPADGGSGVLGSAAAAVGNALRSAKDAVFGKGKGKGTDHGESN